jgi:hypothetical protein
MLTYIYHWRNVLVNYHGERRKHDFWRTTALMGTGRPETEDAMTRHNPGQTIGKLTAAATLQMEATHQYTVMAWGQTLFTEVARVWAQLDCAETLAYEDKVAAQVHVLEDTTASLTLLSDTLERTSRRLRRHLQSLHV